MTKLTVLNGELTDLKTRPHENRRRGSSRIPHAEPGTKWSSLVARWS